MSEIDLLQHYLVVGGLLFGIGMIGFVLRRNMIVMFLSAEMMLQGVSLNLVAWGRYHHHFGGQMMVLFIIAVAACEAAIGLALIVALFQKSGRLDAAFWNDLREEGQPAFVDQNLPEERSDERLWPHLTPSGVAPVVDPEELAHRSRI
jgi:NADH-quinone oxidoreductase subunit K